MNDIFSFYQLISNYQIEIPIIQRDYAQGRNNPKAEDVRKSMVTDLISAVKGEKRLFFDFVYGRIDENKFIPFDGQQRLTTLYLFHKYIFEKCQSSSTCDYKTNCICKNILWRFSYATRQSSREFCEQLVANNIIPSAEYVKSISDDYARHLPDKQEADRNKKTDEYIKAKTDWMSSFIKNQWWFYSDWEKDPTIMGMLVMLDEMHNSFQQQLENKAITDFKPLAERLTSGCSCPITFHFVDMGKHKLSDETYVKMNARGKTLTPFENFKASLEQYLEKKKEGDILSRLKENADGKWLDWFWSVVNEGKKEKELPDDAMMSFVNRHFMNVWRCLYARKLKPDDGETSLTEEELERYHAFNQQAIAGLPLYPTKDDFVSWDIYQRVLDECGVDECLLPIFNIWDYLDKDKSIINDCQAVWNRKDVQEKWDLYVGKRDNNSNRETYPSRVAFYALLKFFVKGSNSCNTQLAQWMRVVWNIIENSTIDSEEPYHAALRLIDKLSTKCDDIYDALARHFEDFNLGNRYHAEEQIKEERIKAIKIIDDHSWIPIIEAAEQNPYLRGKIWVLFQNDDKTDISLFENRLKLLTELLNNEDKYHLAKVLVSYYNKEKPNKTINLKKTEPNWKVLLTDKEKGLFDCFRKVFDNGTNSTIPYQWIIDIAKTQLLNNSRDDAKIIGTYGNSVVLWGTTGCRITVFGNDVSGNVVIGNYRTLLADIPDIKLCKKGIKVPNTSFVSDINVNFIYNYKGKDYIFQWYGVPNELESDVYLMEVMEDKRKDYKRRHDQITEGIPDNENYYCFRVTKEMEDDTALFTDELACLITQAFPNEADKTCCYNCQDKTCE